MAIVNMPDIAGTEFEYEFQRAKANEQAEQATTDGVATLQEWHNKEWPNDPQARRGMEGGDGTTYVMPLQLKVVRAYTVLKQARNDVFTASEHEGRCKDALDAAERDLLLSGTIDGKNAELRAAQMFNRTEVQRTQLYQAQSKRRRAELDLQLATDEVQRIRTLVALITAQA